MIEINKSQNCGNSPKNIFAQEFAIALSRRDTHFLLDNTSDDVLLTIVGERDIRGKPALEKFIEDTDIGDLAAITIQHVVTHGKAGSVNGSRIYRGGGREAFCDVYEFTNAKGNKIARIQSYVIKIEPDISGD